MLMLALAVTLAGCSVINTGPDMARQTGAIAQGGAKALLAAYQPQQTQMAIDGAVNDPCYRVRVFVGAGTVVDMELSLAGAELAFGVNSSGKGIVIDDDLKRECLDIIGRADLSELQREEALTNAFIRWVDRWTSPAGESAPEGAVVTDQ